MNIHPLLFHMRRLVDQLCLPNSTTPYFSIYSPNTFSSVKLSVYSVSPFSMDAPTLLCYQQPIPLLQRHPMPAEPRQSPPRGNLTDSTTHLEYLSSGENRAGWADFVTSLPCTFFNVYTRLPSASRVYMRCMVSGGRPAAVYRAR